MSPHNILTEHPKSNSRVYFSKQQAVLIKRKGQDLNKNKSSILKPPEISTNTKKRQILN